MPLYLQTIGFSAVWIGFLEGFAQVMIGFSTGYFGKLSDQTGARMPFVRIGYTLSALAKPMMIFWSSIGWVFFSRVSERLGKGIRTSARDALLADESKEGERDMGCGMQDTGYGIQDTGYRMQDIRYRIQDVGYMLKYLI